MKPALIRNWGVCAGFLCCSLRGDAGGVGGVLGCFPVSVVVFRLPGVCAFMRRSGAWGWRVAVICGVPLGWSEGGGAILTGVGRAWGPLRASSVVVFSCRAVLTQEPWRPWLLEGNEGDAALSCCVLGDLREGKGGGRRALPRRSDTSGCQQSLKCWRGKGVGVAWRAIK